MLDPGKEARLTVVRSALPAHDEVDRVSTTARGGHQGCVLLDVSGQGVAVLLQEAAQCEEVGLDRVAVLRGGLIGAGNPPRHSGLVPGGQDGLDGVLDVGALDAAHDGVP